MVVIMSKLTDTHCHLQHDRFKDDLNEVIDETEKNLAFTIVSGANKEWNRKAIDISKKSKNIYATIGLHPIDAEKMSEKEFQEELKFVEENKDNLVGIGEIGLDFHWEKDEKMRDLQKERFVRFLNLSKNLNLPVVIHSWDAEIEVLDILEKEKMKKVVMHCFSGNLELMEKALELGYYISISTIILRSKSTRKLARDCPLEKMLLETDAPYLWLDGKRNVPWNTEYAAEKIAKIRKITKDEVLEATLNNAKKIFGI
ncbi:MAG: TatD family hydrolase [Candidatus Aenigmarchaeota archaeon]|nr:TatD family hydrolase [Candidatus Aenigmarchaeota archaeon]